MLYIMESMLYYSVAMNENIESVQTPPSVPRGIPKWIPRLGILAAIATILSRRWLPQHADADMMLRTLVALAPIPIWLAWAWATQRRISLLDEMERLMIYEGWFFAGIGTLFVLMGAAQLDLALQAPIAMKNRLREMRAAKKWSQSDLAEKLGVSRQTVNAIETGRYDPSLPLAFKVAHLFEVAIEEVFTPDAA
jgi:putative transcriptional regulator